MVIDKIRGVGREIEEEEDVEIGSACVFFFFFKQKTAYEIYQCDWSSDVCSSDLQRLALRPDNRSVQ